MYFAAKNLVNFVPQDEPDTLADNALWEGRGWNCTLGSTTSDGTVRNCPPENLRRATELRSKRNTTLPKEHLMDPPKNAGRVFSGAYFGTEEAD